MAEASLNPADAVIVVDVQKDFCPGGALPVAGGDEVVPVLNQWIGAAQKAGAKIVVSRDWHPPTHSSFKEYGGVWPPHCVQNTEGADFHPDLNVSTEAIIVTKGDKVDHDEYSDFEGTGLGERLKEQGVRRVWVGGLALDVCVRATVLDALKLGFEVHVIRDGTRAVNVQPGDGDRALEEMSEAGAIIEEGELASDV
jgi:nicotinamidase/pyrazinamidase